MNNKWKNLRLVFTDAGAGGGGGAPSPADVAAAAAAAAEATRIKDEADAAAALAAAGGAGGAGSQQEQQTETPEQKIARLEAANATLEREKENVRIQKLGTERTEAKRQELLSLAKVTGLDIKEPDKETVATLTEKLTGKVMEGDTSKDEAKAAKVELAIYKTANKPELRINPDKLANSVSFMKATADLDPTDPEFETKLTAAMQAELTKDPSIKVSGGTGSSGPDAFGGAGGAQAVTPEQFKAMSMADKTKLFQTNPALFERLANG